MLGSNSYLVIFGGGAPTFEDIFWQVASSGRLSLNNSGDSIYLYDSEGEIVQQITYGAEGGGDQSLACYPEGQCSEFQLHSQIPGSGGSFYSPGTSIDGNLTLPVTIPEPTTLSLLGFGILG